jgi:hypothetical protein
MRPFILAAALLPLALATSCAAPDPLPTISSLRFATETRAVAAGTHGLQVDGPMDVTLEIGATPSLVIEANDNLLPRITSETRDGVLHLDMRGWTMGVTRLKARLTLPQADTIRVHGVGNVEATGLAGRSLDLAISGAGSLKATGNIDRIVVELSGTGSVRLAGAANYLSASISGVGQLDADALVAQDATVSISGIGGANLQALRTLAVTRSGIGSVVYRGTPQVTATGGGIGGVRAARS